MKPTSEITLQHLAPKGPQQHMSMQPIGRQIYNRYDYKPHTTSNEDIDAKIGRFKFRPFLQHQLRPLSMVDHLLIHQLFGQQFYFLPANQGRFVPPNQLVQFLNFQLFHNPLGVVLGVNDHHRIFEQVGSFEGCGLVKGLEGADQVIDILFEVAVDENGVVGHHLVLGRGQFEMLAPNERGEVIAEMMMRQFLQVGGLLGEEFGRDGEEEGRYFYFIFIQALEDDDEHYNKLITYYSCHLIRLTLLQPRVASLLYLGDHRKCKGQRFGSTNSPSYSNNYTSPTAASPQNLRSKWELWVVFSWSVWSHAQLRDRTPTTEGLEEKSSHQAHALQKNPHCLHGHDGGHKCGFVCHHQRRFQLPSRCVRSPSCPELTRNQWQPIKEHQDGRDNILVEMRQGAYCMNKQGEYVILSIYVTYYFQIQMFQSNSGNNSRVLARESVDSTIDHRIDIACLAILIVGLFSCLIRSDYNFAIIFFIYFVWQQRKDSLSLKIILGSTIVLIVFDLIFALTEIRVWTSEDPGNGVWQTLRPMHNFGIFCFILILILKIGLIIVTVQGIRSINKAVQSI